MPGWLLEWRSSRGSSDRDQSDNDKPRSADRLIHNGRRWFAYASEVLIWELATSVMAFHIA